MPAGIVRRRYWGLHTTPRIKPPRRRILAFKYGYHCAYWEAALLGLHFILAISCLPLIRAFRLRWRPVILAIIHEDANKHITEQHFKISHMRGVEAIARFSFGFRLSHAVDIIPLRLSRYRAVFHEIIAKFCFLIDGFISRRLTVTRLLAQISGFDCRHECHCQDIWWKFYRIYSRRSASPPASRYSTKLHTTMSREPEARQPYSYISPRQKHWE